MANLIFNYFKKAVLQGTWNIGANSPPIYCALVNNSYSPNIDTDLFVGQFIGTYEVAGSGYTAGGKAVSSPNIQQDDTLNQGVLQATDIMWANVSVTARGAVLYGSSGAGFAADPLIAYIDFVTDQAAVNGTFLIDWAAAGVLAIS